MPVGVDLKVLVVLVVLVVWYTTAKHDSLQVELLAEFLTILIHTASQAQTTIIRDLITIITTMARAIMGPVDEDKHFL